MRIVRTISPKEHRENPKNIAMIDIISYWGNGFNYDLYLKILNHKICSKE
jgi:hypothetical protein